ncbi:Bifunctional inhibitor/plant lipid transfer protein/seed storage helical domain containing protein [Parasponia andersonii]|uniref:Bifunctional inhibitor/plant lipid transfer protein/seed storage helical domain containing protein n=1 Tax=Parasponia andersonii TaxID=3476 RepID=A0A2P5DW41_PARAD|nr:Bifunctional inhibitor/plant lipid transfer protein/seed storage helical domain containing protein [Parasponia andersonii]
MKKWSFLALCMVVAAVLLSEAPTAEAVKCSPLELIRCLPAITRGIRPTKLCCTKLKQQKPCLCGFLKDPNFLQYAKSPNARKVAARCHVSYPKCR